MTRGNQPPARHIRQRKLLPKQLLQILNESDINQNEYQELLRILDSQNTYETGVEKSEENEYHLQAALAGKGEKAEVPAPPAEESRDINYDELYSENFQKPASYIRFSQTVEECTGCQYDMSAEDNDFLKSYNEKRPVGVQCSEDDFERMMDVLERVAGEETPFASVDNTVISFNTVEPALKQQTDSKLHSYSKDVYEHWRARRQAASNRPIQPSLKFETHQENDDGDPYVCFRRRDVRQTRKTRARDVQSTEKLRRLRKELEEGRQLLSITHQRESMKRDLLAVERTIFEQRTKLKEAKTRLGIKGDDEDLINQKPQKRKVADTPHMQRPVGTQLRIPTRPDGRTIEADLTLLADVLAQKENQLQTELELRVQHHKQWNQKHIDLTKAPLSPVHEDDFDSEFRRAITRYPMTPPASVSSESSNDPLSPVNVDQSRSVRYLSPAEDSDDSNQPAFRRRVGRLNRLWIDRRNVPSMPRQMDEIALDRWKYDQDDDDDQPIYEVDQYDTKAMRFRSTIPFPAHLLSRRSQLELSATASQSSAATTAAPASSSPNRATAAAPQQKPQAPG